MAKSKSAKRKSGDLSRAKQAWSRIDRINSKIDRAKCFTHKYGARDKLIAPVSSRCLKLLSELQRVSKAQKKRLGL